MNHKYFTITELCYSDTALSKRIKNVADVKTEERLSQLIINVLDPLRERYGKAISISSGYRCKKLNQSVGGVKNSHHMLGYAADITAGSKSANRTLAQMICELGLPFDQLIDEKNYAWIHVSYRCDGDNRGQILRYNGRNYLTIKETDL